MPGRKRTPGKQVPTAGTIKRHCQKIGRDCWTKYVALREEYKLKGLTSRQAAVRAYSELNIGALHSDANRKEFQAEIQGVDGALTTAEMQALHPDYTNPLWTQAEEIGKEEWPWPDQVRWAKRRAAGVKNGQPQPKSFPSEDVLWLFQKALNNDTMFDKWVAQIEAPSNEADSAFSIDAQYQIEEISTQLRQALEEVGLQLRELEERVDIPEALDRVLSDGPKGPRIESAVSA